MKCDRSRHERFGCFAILRYASCTKPVAESVPAVGAERELPPSRVA